MLLKNKGFTLIEVLVAFSLIMLLITTFIPISTLLQQHTVILSDRRLISSKLHDELIVILADQEKNYPQSFVKHVSGRHVTFVFSAEKELIKGCGEWENVKNIKEKICLYGYK